MNTGGDGTAYMGEKMDLKKADMGDVITDFRKSDAKQFQGKSDKKIQQMAIAAKLKADGKSLKDEYLPEILDKKDVPHVKKLVSKLRDGSKTHAKQADNLEKAMKEDISDEALLVQDWNVDEIKYTEVEAVDIIKPEPLKPSPSNEVNEMTGVLVKGASKLIPALMTGIGGAGTMLQIKKKADEMDFGKSKRTQAQKSSARNQRAVARLGKRDVNVQGNPKKLKQIFTKKITKPKKSEIKVKKEIISKGFMKDHYDWRTELGEDWQKVNRKDKTDGLSKKAVKAYRRENPGSKLKTAVTKDPKKLKKGSKDAKRRLSFCRRMKGMKKRLTSAKTARDPNSRINKALRRWNC